MHGSFAAKNAAQDDKPFYPDRALVTLLYDVSVRPLAQRVFSHIRQQELLRPGDRVAVAVSGGIDSVALLRLLLELRGELGIALSVVHFNHQLRGSESEADQEFVAGLAREYDLEFHVDGDDVAQHASEEHISVEAAARELRYGFFRYLLGDDRTIDPQGLKPFPLSGTAEAVAFPDSPRDSSEKAETVVPYLDKIATGHTLDDQAETVLMRLIRGAGLRGLGGVYPRIAVEDEDGEVCGEIVRPLLTIRRRELEQYLKEIGQAWRDDSTNADVSFTRNRLRKLVLPLLEREFNPSVAETLAELSEIARGEGDYWENEVAGWMGTVVHWTEPDWARDASQGLGLVQIAPALDAPEQNSLSSQDLRQRMENSPWLIMDASVSRMWFLGQPTAVQRRLVKAIGEQAGIPLEFKHVEEILRFGEAGTGSAKVLTLPLGWRVERELDRLVFLTPDLREQAPQGDYEYVLPVPGTVVVNEAGSEFEVQCIPAGTKAGYNPNRLLDATSLSGPLRVRNWRPGDRFWPAHTKSPKKIKELLQEHHVAPPERRQWPVVVSGDEVVWVRGLPSPSKLRAKPEHDSIFIAEKPLAEKAAK